MGAKVPSMGRSPTAVVRLAVLFALVGRAPAVHARSSNHSTSCPNTTGLSLSASAPRLESAMTHVTLASMASFGTASGPAFYNVVVTNSSSQPQVFRLAVELKFIPSDPAIASSCADLYPELGQGCWIQRQSTYDITVPARGSWIKSSNQINRLVTGGIGGEDNPFRSMVNRQGEIPGGKIRLYLGLICPAPEGDPMGEPYSSIQKPPGTEWWGPVTGTYQPVQSPRLLSPGGPVGDGFPALVMNPPMFVFAGNLDRVAMGGNQPYRLSVWEFPEGSSLDDVQSRNPARTTQISRGPVVWPSAWPPLEAGKRYVWRVDALMHGITDDWLPSATWAFAVPSSSMQTQSGTSGAVATAAAAVSIPLVSGTAEQNEILQLLAVLAGQYRPNVEGELRTKLPDPSSLRIGGRPATVDDLRSLVQDYLSGRTSVHSAGVAP